MEETAKLQTDEYKWRLKKTHAYYGKLIVAISNSIAELFILNGLERI